jgi:hypothetical protein
MNLDDAQKRMVQTWIGQGLQPAEIQKRLADELGVRLTYMEVRFLLADLNLKPKDKEPSPKALPTLGKGAPDNARPTPRQVAASPAEPGRSPEEAGGVSVTVDQLTRPGAVVSGKVKFSDGKTADWYLDQMGRLGLAGPEKGYRPSQPDLLEFQATLQDELAKLGF